MKQNTKNHQQRLRNRFLLKELNSRSEESLLELLLTYAIPRKDVQQLAKSLINKFGSIKKVLAASEEELCQIKGIKESTVVLLKLTNTLINNIQAESKNIKELSHQNNPRQQTLFDKEKELMTLLKQLRNLGVNQTGYISGETLKNIEKSNEFLVISTWQSAGDWNRWFENDKRKEIQDQIDFLLGAETEYSIYDYAQ